MKNLRPKLITLILLMLCTLGLASEVMAQTAQSNQADLAEFTVSPDDFGQALINFVTFGSFKDFDTEAPSLMSTIGRVLSTISLFMMAGLAAVGSANYVIQTANKGVPGGQVISSFWMPLRISTATLLLIPLASGYSTIQSKVVYNVASTGNAHASYLATEGASYIIKHGAYKPPILADNAALVNGLIAAEICMAHVNASVGREVVKPVYKQYTGRTELSYDYKVIGGFRRSNYIPNYCGKVELAAPDAAYTGLKEDAIIGDSPSEVFSGSPKDTAQEWYQDYSDVTSRIMVKTFPAVIGALRADAAAIASNIIFDTKALVDLQQNGNEAGFEGMSTQAPANIAAGAELTPALYKKANDLVFSQIAEIINSVHGNPNRDETPLWVQELNKLGWTYLGTTYWQISKNQEEINNMARTLEFKYTEPLPDNEFQNDERFRTLSIRYRDMLALVSESGYKPQADSMKVFIDASGVSDAGNSGSGFYKKFIVGLSQSLMLSLTTSKDADMLVQLQQTGNYVGSFLDLAFHGAMWAKAMAAGVKAGADEAIDSVQDAANSNPLTGVLSLFATPVSSVGKGVAAFAYVIIVEYVELIKGIMPPLLIACFLLAIVLPTIPLFMWLMGIVSWIIFYIECLLISPIWLSAHGTAEKEGWGTEHTRQGYMLMIGLYLNPILRTAGFLAMVKLLYPLGVLIHWLSSYLVGVLVTGAVSSPLMIAGSMLILAFTGYSICMRVFSLPNELFERGLRWVNGGQEVTGDENGSNRINAMVANFGYKSESAMNGKNSSSPIGQNPDPKREKKD